MFHANFVTFYPFFMLSFSGVNNKFFCMSVWSSNLKHRIFHSNCHCHHRGKGRVPEKRLLFFWILSKLPPPPLPPIWTRGKTFFGRQKRKRQTYEKVPKNSGSVLPPLIWTKSKRTAAFFRNPSLILITGLLIRGENWLVVVVVVRQS